MKNKFSIIFMLFCIFTLTVHGNSDLSTKLSNEILEKGNYSLNFYTKPKRILILHSYHTGFKWTDDITQGIKSLFPKETNVSITIEYMGTKRRSDKEYLDLLKQNYKYLYEKDKFDLIIASDNHALDFLIQNRDELFKDVPVVFCGVNFFKKEQLKGIKNFTGVSEEGDFISTLDTALKLHPNTKNVLLISDQTKTGKILINRLEKDIQKYDKNINFIFPKESNMKSIIQSIKELPQDSIILYTLFFQDDQKIYFSYSEALQIVTGVREDIPIYGTWDYSLGHKIIGGKLISGLKQGLEAASIAHRVLAGVPIDRIKVVKEEATQFMFDKDILDKFNIPIQLLPKKSIIINKNEILENKTLSLNKKEKKFLKKNPIIKVSNQKDWAPFDFTIGDKPQGYFIDLLKIISTNTGIKFKFINGLTRNQLNDKFNKKEIDLMQPVIIDSKSSRWIYSNPAHIYKTSYATRKNIPKINKLKDLRGKTVAVEKGFTIEGFLKKLYPKIKLITVNSVREGLDLVSKGKVFAMIDSDSVLKYTNKKYYYTNISVQGWVKEYDKIENKKLHFMTHKDKPELISIINKALSSITPIQINELEKKWFSKKIINETLLSEDETLYLKKKKIIKMCIIPKYLPYSGIDNKGNYTGISAEILKEVEKSLGIKLKLYRTNTWEESIKAVKNKKCDILPLAQKLQEREEYLNFTKPYILPTSVIVTGTNELFVKNISEIQDKKIGIIKDYAIGKLIKKVYPNLNIIPVENLKDGLEKVQNKEIYGYIDSLGAIAHEIQKQGNYELKIAGKVGFDLNLSLATRKDEPILHSIFSKAINSFPETKIKEILNKWISIKYQEKVDYTLLYQISAILLIILASFIIWNRKLQAEIEKRHKIEEELIKAREDALKASKAKSDFLANMSHEIRTPMNGVIGMTTLALSKIDNDVATAKDFLKKGQNSAHILLGVINDILDFSKIEAGKLDVEIRPMCLRETISRLNDLFSYTAKQKDLNFIIEQDELIPEYILGDQLRLSQVLTNLISNAIKFTHRGSVKIKIELLSKENENIELKFSVEDTGKGIQKENQQKLFKSFSQEDSSISRRYGGTGLGLAICKELVFLMDGNINFKSIKDEGTTFFFTLKTKLASKKRLNTNQIFDGYEEFEAKKILNTKVLLVEDNDINRELAFNFLKEIVSDVDFASNGKQASDMILEKPENYYSVVLMDIHMPVMDGFKATSIIRKQKRYENLPIIALTANVLKSDIKKYLNIGMNDYIPKPFEVKELHQKVYYWINKNKKVKTLLKKDPLKKETISPTLDAESAIERMIGREDLYKNFLTGFLENRTNDISLITKEINENNIQNAINIIHTLKGIVNTLGAQKLGELLAQNENNLRNGKNIDRNSIKKIEEEFIKVIEKVEKWIKNN